MRLRALLLVQPSNFIPFSNPQLIGTSTRAAERKKQRNKFGEKKRIKFHRYVRIVSSVYENGLRTGYKYLGKPC